MQNQYTCPECHGEGQVYYSCCSGEIVTNDWHLCPECREHLGEEDCETCDGKGWIEPECDAKKEDAKYEADEIKYYERMEREADFKAYLNRED